MFSLVDMALNHNFLSALGGNIDYLVLRLNISLISFQDLFDSLLDTGKINVYFFHIR